MSSGVEAGPDVGVLAVAVTVEVDVEAGDAVSSASMSVETKEYHRL